MAFTDAPRRLAQAILCTVNQDDGASACGDAVEEVLTNYELLESQAKLALGEKLYAEVTA